MKNKRETVFCNKCGENLVLVKSTKGNFNTKTGKKSNIEEYKCPNYNFFGMHTKVKVYFDGRKILFEDNNLGAIGD